ncbi:MAG TPA: lysophospholipid acyltransferase family protein [Steroidobacteraceae bacterium]|jgi:KDO2-lipid IV(A) lauroyltransferase
MLTKVSPDKSRESTAKSELAPEPAAWWVRVLAVIPLSWLYGFAFLLGWLAYRVFPYRKQLVRQNLALGFPGMDERALRATMRAYYAGFAQMLVEIIRSAKLPGEEIQRRVRIRNIELPLEWLAQGKSVLLVAAHQCNWEWMLLALSLTLGYPVDAAYKPLVNPWAEREMKKVRSRFGSRLVPAKELLADMIRRRAVVRAVAMVADQEPTTSEHKHWTRFLNRDTAFYMGPEEISRATRLPVLFILMRRLSKGFYEMEFELLARPGDRLQPGELTERYARRVEQQIHAAPADWPWSHKRWKLKRSLYGKASATSRPRS